VTSTFVRVMLPPNVASTPWAPFPLALIVPPVIDIDEPLPVANRPFVPDAFVVTLPLPIVTTPAVVANTPEFVQYLLLFSTFDASPVLVTVQLVRDKTPELITQTDD
jgi:hypothetical protein